MDRMVPLVFGVYCALMALGAAADAQVKEMRVGVVAGIERELAVVDDELTGRFSPYYRCVFAKTEGQFQFLEMPLAQILYQLDKGGITIGLPLVQTADRDQFADFGGLLFQTEYVYLMLEQHAPLSQSSGLRYGLIRRFVGKDLMLGERPELRAVSEWEQAVNLLKRGRVDVVVLPWVLVDKLMDGYQGDFYVRNAAWVDLSLYVSHAHSDGTLIERIRAAIRACRYQNDKE